MTADALVEELKSAPAPDRDPTRPAKVNYSHAAMIDLIVTDPWIDQNQIAAHFGYTPAWVSRIIGSDAFQAQLASRREEVIDPAMKATIKERFQALVVQSLAVLERKLAQPTCSDTIALRAAELGAKALGVGGHAAPAPQPTGDRLAIMAERLLILQSNVRKGIVYEGESVEVGLRNEGREVGRQDEAADSLAADQVAV